MMDTMTGSWKGAPARPGLSAALIFISALALVLGARPYPVRAEPAGANSGGKRCAIRFARSGWCATIDWVQAPHYAEAPTAKDAGAFDLVLSSPDEKPAKPPGPLTVRLWMPEMGHGSLAPEVRKDPADPVRYHVRRVLFSMEGRWEIRLELRGSPPDHAQFDYRYAPAP